MNIKVFMILLFVSCIAITVNHKTCQAGSKNISIFRFEVGDNVFPGAEIHIGPVYVYCNKDQRSPLNRFRVASINEEIDIPNLTSIIISFDGYDVALKSDLNGKFVSTSEIIDGKFVYFLDIDYKHNKIKTTRIDFYPRKIPDGNGTLTRLYDIIQPPSIELKHVNEINIIRFLKEAKIKFLEAVPVNCPASLRPFEREYFDVTFKTNPEGAEIWVDGNRLEYLTNKKLRIPAHNQGSIVVYKMSGYAFSIRQIGKENIIEANLIKIK